MALARALAVASADDAALGQTRGIRELAPFFVLLRRLASVPEYATAMASAALAGARESAAATAESTASPTRKSAAADEKALLRLSFLSRVIARVPRGALTSTFEAETRGQADGMDADLPHTTSGTHRELTTPLLDALLVAAETLHARDSARGAPPLYAAASTSSKGDKSTRKRKDKKWTSSRRAAPESLAALLDRDLLDPSEIDPGGREDDKRDKRDDGDELKLVTRRARFGNPSFATSVSAFRGEPATHSGVADAADALGARLGFGAALDPTPPFTPVSSRKLRSARLPVGDASIARREYRVEIDDGFSPDARERFEAFFFENAAGLVAALAGGDSTDGVSVKKSGNQSGNHKSGDKTPSDADPLILDAASRRAWVATLAGALASPRRSKTCGARRVARRALLALAGSKRAYRAARDAATLSVVFDSLARAALPASGAWFEQRAPYAIKTPKEKRTSYAKLLAEKAEAEVKRKQQQQLQHFHRHHARCHGFLHLHVCP